VRPTLDLLSELSRQVRSLAEIELSLVRAELAERGGQVSSSLAKAAVGLVFLLIGLTLIFVALSLALQRFGIPLDLGFLIVALLMIAAGSLALFSGLRALKPARLVPTRSLSQISSLIGELHDADRD
jgi:hypothetical protein